MPDPSMLKQILFDNGYNPYEDSHLQETERRWVSVIAEYCYKPFDEALLTPEFADSFHGLIVVQDIEFSSLCAHHLMPFSGMAAIGFLPDGKVLGISKFARIIEHFTHQITIQEKATREIAEQLLKLEPRGLAVLLQGSHSCMTARGVRRPGSIITTAEMHGLMRTGPQVREEFYSILARGSK